MANSVADVENAERLKQLRMAAKERFDSLPWPTQTEEEWRRTDPARFSLDNLTLSQNGASVQARIDSLPPEILKAGGVAAPLSAAIQEHPDLIERFLFQGGQPEALAKWTALHEAHWSQGFFIYVPRGVVVELPVRVTLLLTQAGATAFPHGVVVVDEGAQLTLVDERRPSAGYNGRGLSNEWVEIFVKSSASLRYVRLQHLPEQAAELYTQQAVLEKDAQFLNVMVGLGCAVSKANIETRLAAAGAHADLLGLFFGHREQHFDCHTLQDHMAPSCSTDLFYESALKDKAQAIYTGLIRIRKRAQKSDAYQHNRSLLLSQGAKADSIPMLEIEADDVRCTHGVAVGPVDEEQLYYLMSRGLPRRAAQRLVVGGFFDQVLRRIPIESVRETLLQEINLRLEEETPHGPVG